MGSTPPAQTPQPPPQNPNFGRHPEAESAIDALPGMDDASAAALVGGQTAFKAPEQPKAGSEPGSEPDAPKADTKPTDKPKSRFADLDEIDQPKDDPKAKDDKKPSEVNKDALPDPDDETFKRAPKQLREAYQLTKKERDDLRTKIADLEKANSEGTKRQVDEATKALNEQIEKIKKDRDELDTKVKYLDFKQSSEWKEKYEAPLEQAKSEAADAIKGFQIRDVDGMREATLEDIYGLVKLPPLQAAQRATELFGAGATEIMAHRRNLIDKAKAAANADQEWSQKGATRAAEERKASEAFRERANRIYEDHLKARATEMPALFGDDPEDKDGNSLLAKSNDLVELAFRQKGLPEGLTAEEKQEYLTQAQAEVALRAKAFSRERLRVNRALKQVEELKAKLAKFEKSEPKDKTPESKEASADKERSWEAQIDAMTYNGR